MRNHNSLITINPYSDASHSVGLPQPDEISEDAGKIPSDKAIKTHSQTNVKLFKINLKPDII